MSEGNGSRSRCQGTRTNGDPCGSVIVGSDGYCYEHDPNVSPEERAAAKLRGGETTARRLGARGLTDDDLPLLDSPQAAEVWCERIGRAVVLGTMTPSQGQAALRSVSEWSKAHDLAKTTRRLEELEKTLRELKGDSEPWRSES